MTRTYSRLICLNLSSWGSALSSYSISDPHAIRELQSETYKLVHPGPNPVRQDIPHPHDAVLDPTGHFILVPDLGADLVRVYAVDNDSLTWTEVTPLTVVPGSGPRHVAFLVAKEKTFMYILTELSNRIIGYEITYNKGNTLGFTEISQIGTHGKDKSVPKGAFSSEILISVSFGSCPLSCIPIQI